MLDFGVARMLEGPVTATRPGGIIGTPAFMAPEQVLDKIVDAQSDLWSVGATAFALLSKRYVHEAESAGEMMVAVGSRPARSLGLVAPDVPPALAMVIDRALMFNKANRWALTRERCRSRSRTHTARCSTRRCRVPRRRRKTKTRIP